MDVRIQNIIAICVLIALFILVNMIRKKKLQLQYALAWLFVGVGILILDCFPSLIEKVSAWVGIADPVNMLFFCGFCFTLIIIFVLTLAISKMSISIRKLAQELALYKKEDNI